MTLPSVTVLVVEDDRQIRRVVEGYLRQAGWGAFDHGHHVNGTLTFPLTHGGSHRYLDGADSVTVTIKAAEGDGKVSFTWKLQ